MRLSLPLVSKRARAAYWHYRSRGSALWDLLRPPVIELKGTAKGTDESVRVCHAGGAERQYRLGFPAQIMQETEQELRHGRKWWWQVRPLARALDCAFLVAEIPSWLRRPIGRVCGGTGKSYFLPYFVRTDRDISDLGPLLEGNSNLKEDVRRVRKQGYQYRITTEPEDYEVFLKRFYRPLVESVHGSFAIIFDYSFLYRGPDCDRSGWELLKVMQGDQWVAGCILRRLSDVAESKEIGVLDADPTIVKKSAMAAAYWFFVQYAREIGYSKVSFMWSPPFLRNGVLRFKAKYRPTCSPVPRDHRGILLVPALTHSVARRLLIEQPLLQISGDELKATAFIDEPGQLSRARGELEKETKNLFGIAELEIVLLADDESELRVVHRETRRNL